ncbi:hypothetical protein [Halarcobacter anaerophilus]|uniref:hypothetical protein n=1 Tax=Halarcobacter anaerophilus TaxID=877500 RepID=UPI0006982777|nr:hypothetical protein [Halarcobacter anaerophilus]
MRTIEMLGAKRKILTANIEVVKYDFYNKDNIFVFDRNNPKIDIEFFMKDYKGINHISYEKYSINQWIKNIFKDINE